jgi:regulator of replication initiation timing
VSSLSFSDVSILRASSSKRTAAVAERALEILAAREAVQRDNAELEEFKREKKKEVSDLRAQLQQLVHDKELLTMKLDHVQHRADADRNEFEDRYLGPARSRLAALEAEAARAREGLEASKQKFSAALHISRAEYDQLAATPDSERSVAQHLSVLVFDMLEDVRKGRDAARREAEMLRQSLGVTAEELTEAQKNWEAQHNAAAERHREQSKVLQDTSSRASVLQLEVERLSSQLAAHEARSKRCEQAEDECKAARADRLAALADRDEARAGCERAETERKEAMERAMEREREAEMLRLDKEFLARQVAELTARSQSAEDKVERKGLKLKDALRAKEQLEAQMLQMQTLNAVGG